jgi:two-component system sensor histidine kinase TtrS
MQLYRKRKAILFLMLACFSFNARAHTEDTLKIGVLAMRSTEICLEEWQATAVYLSEQIPDKEFVIVPMPFEAFQDVGLLRGIDLFISNPAIFISIEEAIGVHAMVTLKKLYKGQEMDVFGGVIFTRSGEENVRELKDLKARRIAAVDKTSFGGWHVAKREMLQEKELKGLKDGRVVFTGSHDKVVELVLEGVVDVGIVRTGIIENMADRGLICLEDVKVINECEKSFPLFCSTRLYSEWPLSYSGVVEEELVREIAIAMLSLTVVDRACIDAGISGWELPGNYKDVKTCIQRVKAPPYEEFGRIEIEDIFKQYGIWMLLILALFTMGVLFLLIRLSRLRLLSERVSEEQKDIRRNYKRRGVFVTAVFGIASALLGSIVLVSLSMFQKMIMGVEFMLNGFIIPSTFGAATGLIIGLAFNRVIIQREQAKLLSEMLDRRNAELEEMVDEVKLMNAELGETKSRAVAADKLKTSFLTNLSHEIRTPMSGIVGFVELLKTSELQRGEINEYSEMIKSSSDRLLNTINDLVNMSLIDTGLMELYIEEVDGGDVVLKELALRQVDIELKNLELEICEAFTEKALLLKADRKKFESVVHHLLDNAIKFSHSGGMIIIGCEEEDAFVKISIIDNGKGIKEDMQASIFYEFSKGGDSIMYSEAEGVGLGLSIARAYVELMGGRIWFESEVGEGSRFYFTVPLA